MALDSIRKLSKHIYANLLWYGSAAFSCFRAPSSHKRLSDPPAQDPLVEGLRVERDRLQQDLQSARGQITHLTKELESRTRREEWMRKENAKAEAAAQEMSGQLRALQLHTHTLEGQLQQERARSQERDAAYKRELDSLQALAETRRQELKDSQTLLTTASVLSDADIMQMVKNLNSEIYQTAAAIANYDHPQDPEARGFDPDAIADAYNQAGPRLGPRIAEFLKSGNYMDNSILLQIALQTALTDFVGDLVSSWDFQHENTVLYASVYDLILRAEPQAIAGRWRALTRRHSNELVWNGSDPSPHFVEELNELLWDVLIVAGANDVHHLEDLSARMMAKLQSIVRSALDIHRVMGEEVISSEFELSLIECEELFGPERMEDAYADDIPKPDGSQDLRVIGTVAVGLSRREIITTAEGKENRRITLLKPHVVLETILHELGGEPTVDDERV